MKVAKLAEQLSKYHKINIVNLLGTSVHMYAQLACAYSTVATGGNDITPEARRLASPVPIDLLIATPSRMKAHLMQTLGFASRLKDLRYLAVADGDRILRESLEKDVVKILGQSIYSLLICSSDLHQGTSRTRSIASRYCLQTSCLCLCTTLLNLCCGPFITTSILSGRT